MDIEPQSENLKTPLVTVVIGAGPAGLLFCILSRILQEQAGDPLANGPIYLYDKRKQYIRTHRLRISSKPYRLIQKYLKDSPYDDLIAFLTQHHFNPTVNQLEEKLETLVNRLGIHKETITIGLGDEAFNLSELRQKLESEGRLNPEDRLMIVAADSVHSTIRNFVRGEKRPIEHTHQTLARLKVFGKNLPQQLGAVNQYKLSKVLHSILDYRINPNGFAEIDLFLNSKEQMQLEALGSTPKSPALLTKEGLKALNAPLFRRFIHHFQEDIAEHACEVYLQSTFRLEHRYMEKVVYDLPGLNAQVFLVGDAAISLPFFRGMACLASCAWSLAQTHHELSQFKGFKASSRYEEQTRDIRLSEISIVQARSWLVWGAREFCRLSTFLPFPVQTWFLSFPETQDHDNHISAGLVFNTSAALISALAALSAPVLVALNYEGWGIIWYLALPFQMLGGVAYRATQEFEPRPDTHIRRIWRFQIALLFIVGIGTTVFNSLNTGRLMAFYSAFSWFILAIAFVMGIYIFEFLDRRWFSRADFDES